MKQVWLILTQEESGILLNIMTDNQRCDLIGGIGRKKIISQIKIGCDDICICNVNCTSQISKAHWFDRILIGKKEEYRINEYGSLLCEGD